ncbi:MAG: hypothetical protein R6U40_12620 [Desulfobacterales bacterium]
MDYQIHDNEQEKKISIEFQSHTKEWTWEYNYEQLVWVKKYYVKKCSWILLYLGEKDYVPFELLTDIYKITQRIHPDNDIDWVESFLIAAKQRFLDECAREKVRKHLNTLNTEG